MMWKRSIVQATTGCARATAALAMLLAVFASTWRGGACADLVIEIPGSVGGEAEADGGRYRLDYRPPHGTPPPNFTVPARANTINFQGLPGTKYHFMLYYSNATFADLLTWNQTIITAPEPPTNLTVTLGRNKQAYISWSPPAHGDYTGFRFKVIPLTERAEGGAQNFSVERSAWNHTLRELSPGATYQLHAFTLLHDKESAAYASRNFTTKPNTPGKFIVWFRNETTLLVLWQPPYPPGAYTHYKVSIVPPDARDSELYVEKEGEPPGPAQAAFKGLVPGRAYNISVQTVSEPEISAPTTAQYRTVPLRPRNVTVPLADLKETSFKVTWLPPLEESEFEKYQVSVSGSGGGGRRLAPVVRARNDTPACAFDGLEPGAPYTVTVKTMSGKVTSWPAATDLTLKPLPVRDLAWRHAADGAVDLWWAPAPASTQDEYKVSYHEAGPSRDDSNTLSTTEPRVTLRALLAGRNYSVWVAAVSRGVAAEPRAAALATRPLAPVLLAARASDSDLRLSWRSDVNSRQDGYELSYRRAAPPDPPTDAAPAADAVYHKLETKETSATLSELFPGAVYEIQLAAVSHGLRSERLVLRRGVRPRPALWLRLARATSNSVLVSWAGPPRRASALGGFVLRYRTAAEPRWTALPPLAPDADRAEIPNMTHGEHYIIELDTLGEPADGDAVESDRPLREEHTVRPNPVSNVEQLVDTRNMTLEWPVPGGRVEWYSLHWRPVGPGAAAGDRNLSAPAGPRARAALDGLQPGRAYTVSIAAHSHNLSSDVFTMDTRTRPLIQSEMTIVNEPGTDDDNDTASTTLKVIYTRTPGSASQFDSYRFQLEGAGAEPRWATRPADAEGQAVEFSGLVPGRLYNVTMWTVSHNVTSHPVQRQARLFPRPITKLNATEVGAREITLAWDKPVGDYTDFEVQYLTDVDQLQTLTTEELGIKVESLRPHSVYTFTVVVVAGRGGALRLTSRGRSADVRTLQAPPPAPRDFRVTRALPAELRLAWDLAPHDANGDLRRFLLDYAPQAEPDRVTTIEFPPDARSGVVSGLVPGAAYVVRVRAETGAGAGPAAQLVQHMAIGAPPRPPAAATPRELRRSSSTVAVRFRADYFSAANGNVTAYTLVLGEEPRNDTPARLPSWRDVHALPAWPPYQVTEPYYPFHSSPVEEFTIGSERCDAGGRAYCNGPLKPGTKYYVKLRAFTAPDKFTDTGYAVVYTGTCPPSFCRSTVCRLFCSMKS